MTAQETPSPEILLDAYAAGVFPMSDSRHDPEIFWVEPRRRGIIPLDGFHISRSLRRRLRQEDYRITVNADFPGVVSACAERPETWINDTIARLYGQLHTMGHAHSLEVWQGKTLAGGVYGVALGGAFFGESMFSHRRDGSKIALAYLVDRLRRGGFVLFDTQFITPHLASLGAVEISQADYRDRLNEALTLHGDFMRPGAPPTPQGLLQYRTQTS
ncbi:leucyl/phenylalanyl-tRNA--protein transferase [Rhodovulum imhoffii]|uniref:Leucyl/phenylalanyl-tRNA--protein transferase n=1 Tax=Rhodovulum imhoffii TaxID=365340 RepID=A0A2T5BNJ4_9RHOB|nr:leucyl/phenylalanyl-tRNA--protein transferase [Rhodovulum imhoffii]MBK5933780.1 leucyl/phenylalanyl-tRNA--protein transferase [Rhodovulum imhoffii]PTN00575.1 leucyl/phenylalanyl-tRNA--protein transferase [Rhodovulum imhoffii]